jgi:hypothetical protein
MELFEDPIFMELKFDRRWIEVGIITPDIFLAIEQKYLTGEDHRSEHYRWGAFNLFFKNRPHLDRHCFYILYDIGKTDPDIAMGRSIIFDLLRHPYCPIELIDISICESDLTLSQHALKLQKIRLKLLGGQCPPLRL